MNKKGEHGEKLVALLSNEKLSSIDKPRVKKALEYYDKWIEKLNEIPEDIETEQIISRAVDLLNEYKHKIEFELIFCSEDDFLYRQKGQLKLDSTIIEEFLPILVKKCIRKHIEGLDLIISSQMKVFSSLHFTASLHIPGIGGGMEIKNKDQDFSISRKLFIQSSYDNSFLPNETNIVETALGYVLAEIKTNLDKTMFQEAAATARDVKLAVTGARYYLICDYLDMTPISSLITDIDEILVLRRAKRLSSNIRKDFSSYEGRKRAMEVYKKILLDNPYSKEVIGRFIDHILMAVSTGELDETSVLEDGFF